MTGYEFHLLIGAVSLALFYRWYNTINQPQINSISQNIHNLLLECMEVETVGALMRYQTECRVYISQLDYFLGELERLNRTKENNVVIGVTVGVDVRHRRERIPEVIESEALLINALNRYKLDPNFTELTRDQLKAQYGHLTDPELKEQLTIYVEKRNEQRRIKLFIDFRNLLKLVNITSLLAHRPEYLDNWVLEQADTMVREKSPVISDVFFSSNYTDLIKRHREQADQTFNGHQSIDDH